jgi:hypothetical protein
MQFQVPQFIEVEDQIFGPFTLRQFIYMAGGAGFTAMMVFLLPSLFLAVIISIPVAGLSAALAFYKINNRPLVELIQSMVAYYMNTNLYIWKPKDAVEIARAQAAIPKAKAVTQQPTYTASASKNRLKDLAWSLDIKESSIYSDKKQR